MGPSENNTSDWYVAKNRKRNDCAKALKPAQQHSDHNPNLIQGIIVLYRKNTVF